MYGSVSPARMYHRSNLFGLRIAESIESCYDEKLQRDVAQLGSALLWGSRGRRFKSSRSDLSCTLMK
jgi:hypothetical protein